MQRRALAVALSALSLLVVAPGCSRGDHDATAPPPPAAAVEPGSTSPTDKAIIAAQRKLAADPGNRAARLLLATAYLQKARETADPARYTSADILLGSLLAEDDRDPSVLVAMGTLQLARHQFADALDTGRRAVVLAPGDDAALGVVADASNELGRYDDALDVTQAMVDTKPGLASLSRVSYARELHGDLQGAVTAMQQAVTAGGSSGGENVAYVQTQLGILLLTAGRLDSAGAAFDAADRAFDGFVPAEVGRARLAIAQGDLDGAATLLDHAAEVQPLVDTVALLGDTRAALGDGAAAKRSFALVAAIAKLYRANGVKTDLEMALFAADHHPGDAAVAAARAALKARPSIFGHDVLAWNLFRNGDPDAAWKEAHRALATGSVDPQIRFHAAAIADAVGDRAAAVEHLRSVLVTNRRFAPRYEPEVDRLASKLGLD